MVFVMSSFVFDAEKLLGLRLLAVQADNGPSCDAMGVLAITNGESAPALLALKEGKPNVQGLRFKPGLTGAAREAKEGDPKNR
ncbi:MAG: hypothetical protein ACE363_01730 [Alphaproteobacteria bacterium]